MVEVPSILIVDDDEGIRQSLALILKEKGYQPTTAETGAAALSLAQDRPFNIALVDVRLSDMEGTELLSRLKESHPDLEVILITAYASLESSIQAVAEGAYRYFTKPLDMDEVMAVIRAALEKQRMLLENKMLYQAAQQELAERKQAEEALRESEARYRAVVEQSADGIHLVDAETRRIQEANSAFVQMLGYTAEEVQGLSIYDFVAANREEIDRRFQDILNEKVPFSYECQYRRKDGSLVEVWVSANLIFYGEKKVVSTLVRDLTEKKAQEAHLLRVQRAECIGLLAGGIAHDLSNLLTPILINAELLGLTLPDPTSQKMLSSIASNAQRGADIVKQILTFSCGMEGKYLLVSPQYLLKEMEGFLRNTFPKTIAVEIEIPQDLWSLSADATQLLQVLMNLCLNAKDAMEKGGTLSLSAKNFLVDEAYARMHPEAKVGPYLVFSVKDTGSGIPPDLLPKIFDPIFTTEERGQGTGIGLSTAHAIVKGHGGFIRVYSEEAKGTRFLVFLPAFPTAEMAKAEKERAPLPSGQGELILVVEDEAPVREITQVTLEIFGYRVLSAADGAEAVALYAQHRGKIQAVITDMAMPIMDGAATIRALQKMDPAVKIIATSGMDAEKMVAEASGLAVQAFLQKPFTAERLLRALAEVLKGGGRGPGVGGQ
ncbi:MAG: response regulator [bacterium]